MPLSERVAQVAFRATALFGEGDRPDDITRHRLGPNFMDVARFDDSPGPGIASFTTLGLSAAPLMRGGEEFGARLELCGAADQEYHRFGEVVAASAAKVLEGEFVFPDRAMQGLVAAVFPGQMVQHVLFMEPFLWDENLTELDAAGRKVLWLQAVPITEAELRYGLAHSMDALTDLLVERGIEPTDLSRRSAV